MPSADSLVALVFGTIGIFIIENVELAGFGMNGFIENQIVMRAAAVGADAEVGLFKMNAVAAL